MAEIDPVVLELLVRDGEYVAKMRNAERVAGQSLGRMEGQFRSSSAAISSSLRTLAGAFAAAFSARELGRLGDTWSDLSSQVGVAIGDMSRAPEIMERITKVARASYSPLEQTAEAFSRNARTLSQMGYSTEGALRYTEALNNALVATATRGDRARQVQDSLSKAIATGKLEAEGLENVLTHGGAVAESMAKHLGVTTNELYRLRKEGKITGDVIVQSLIGNFDDLLAKAESMPATISDGFVIMRNELMRYIGETDKALGITERLAQALIKIADHFDTIIPALAAIAVGLGVGFVTSAARASIAANTTAASFNHMTLQAARGTTALTALGVAARGAGASILAAFGGPVGLALTGIVLSLTYVVTNMESAEQAASRLRGETERLASENDRLADRLRKAGVSIGSLGTKADSTARKIGEMTGAMRLSIGVATDLINRLSQLDMAQTIAAVSELEARKQFIRNPNPLRGPAEAGQAIYNALGINQRNEEVAEIDRQIAELMRAMELRAAAIKDGIDLDDVGGGMGGVAAEEKKKKEKKRTGPTAEDIQRRFEAELFGYTMQSLSAMQQVALSAEERADLEMRAVEWARRQALKEVAADEDYNAAQKAEVSAAIERLAQYERDAVNFQMRRELEQQAQDLAEEHYRAEDERLRVAYDLARTEADRRAIALRILDAEDAYLRSKLEAIRASETATEAERERARIALEALNANASGRRAAVERDHQGAFGRYLDSTADPRAAAEYAAVREMENLRDGLAEGLASQLGVKNDFVKSMLAIFLDQNLFRPMAEALGGGSGGGIFGAILGGIGLPGFATGGSMRIGGRGGMDRNVLSLNGRPIARVSRGETLNVSPNQRLGRQPSQTIVQQTFVLDARHGITTPQLLEHVNRTAQAAAIQTGGAIGQAVVKGIPARMAQYQRDGT